MPHRLACEAERSDQIATKVRKRLERAFAGRRLAKPKDHWQKLDEDIVLDALESRGQG